MEFIFDNWDALVAVLLAAYALAVAVAKLTPTPADDTFLAKIKGYVDAVAAAPIRMLRKR